MELVPQNVLLDVYHNKTIVLLLTNQLALAVVHVQEFAQLKHQLKNRGNYLKTLSSVFFYIETGHLRMVSCAPYKGRDFVLVEFVCKDVIVFAQLPTIGG